MKPLHLIFSESYLSIQAGFEWKDIPKFAIITGINGVGKTQLLDAFQGKASEKISLSYKDGTDAKIILASNLPNTLNLNGLIQYKNNIMDSRMRYRDLGQGIDSWQQDITRMRTSIVTLKSSPASDDEKLKIARLEREIKQRQNWIASNHVEQEKIFIYAYDEELRRLSRKFEKNVEDLTDAEIREYANPYFNSLTEVDDFKRFAKQEEDARVQQYIRLSKEGRESEIKQVRETERSFEKINRLFAKYGFDYFEMLDPFPSDQSRNGEIRFQGKLGEIVEYPSLSSGEQMIVKFIIWAMGTDIRGRRINTMLLDEPDAHLHPSMCRMMVDILHEISSPSKGEDDGGIRIIMTTHSPSTAAFAPRGALFVMEKSADNRRSIRPTTAEEAVQVLSEGIFTFDKVLSKFTLAANTTKSNILFVEGKTDVKHLSKAMEVLGYRLDLEIIDMHDAGALANFIKSVPAKLFQGKKIIALFDCDREGKNGYKAIKGQEIIPNVKQLTAIQCEGLSYAMIIQAPEPLTPYCPIEFLYPFDYLKENDILEIHNFEEYKGLFKSDDPEMEIRFCECYREKSDLRPFKVSDSKKNLFSEYVQRETSKKLFAQFTQTLDIIERIIKSDFPGKTSML